jgi:hypothetical protein
MKKLSKLSFIAVFTASSLVACETKSTENASENHEEVMEQENPAATDAEDANNASVEGDTKETGDNIEDQAEAAGDKTEAAANRVGADLKEAGAEMKQEAQEAGAKLKEGAQKAKAKVKEEVNEANDAVQGN